MSAHAKSVIAALAAVVITGVQAWQVVTVGGFQPVDLLPVATAVVGALLTHVVPNVPELPWAKSVVHGALAVLTALSTFVGSHPAGITAASLLTVATGAFLVYYVPELAAAAPLAPAVEQAAAGHLDSRDILAALAELDAHATPIADEALAAATAITAPLPAVPASAAPAATV